MDELSEREIEVYNLVVEGLLNKEIAAKLGISLQTVKNHLTHIFEKLGLGNRTEIVAQHFQRALLIQEDNINYSVGLLRVLHSYDNLDNVTRSTLDRVIQRLERSL